MKSDQFEIFLNQKNYDKLVQEMTKGQEIIQDVYTSFAGVKIYIDNEVPEDQFFLANHRVMELYKQLKNHPWVDKSRDLFKIAAMLYESEQKLIKVL